MSYDRPLLKEIIPTFCIIVSHLSGDMFPFENQIPKKNNYSHKKNNIPIGYLKFSIQIQKIPKGIFFFFRKTPCLFPTGNIIFSYEI